MWDRYLDLLVHCITCVTCALTENRYRVFGIVVGDLTQYLVVTLITEQVFGAVAREGTVWFGLIFWQKISLLI